MRITNTYNVDYQVYAQPYICVMEVHIGEIIKKVFVESGMRPEAFATAINTVPRNVYALFERREIKTGQLQKISEVLRHDFFQYYRDAEDPQIRKDDSRHAVQIMVELDGSDEQERKWINMIRQINHVVRLQSQI